MKGRKKGQKNQPKKGKDQEKMKGRGGGGGVALVERERNVI